MNNTYKYIENQRLNLDDLNFDKSKDSGNLLLPEDKYNVSIEYSNGKVKYFNLLKDKVSDQDKLDLMQYIGHKYIEESIKPSINISTLLFLSIIGTPGCVMHAIYSAIMNEKLRRKTVKYCKNNKKSPISFFVASGFRRDAIGSILKSIEQIKGKDYEFTLEDFLAYGYNKVSHASHFE